MNKLNLMKKISLFVVFIICSACGLNRPVGHDAPGLDELKRLCEKNAGLTINKTVKADGYYDASRKGSTLWKLIPSDYRFVEFCNFDSQKPSFGEPGCWRLTKVSRDTDQCDKGIDELLMNTGATSIPEFREQNCIAVEKLEKPTARYSYEVERKEWWLDEDEGTAMIQHIGRITDNETKEILGTRVGYSLDQQKYTFLSYISCNDPILTGEAISFNQKNRHKKLPPRLLESILISKKQEKKND